MSLVPGTRLGPYEIAAGTTPLAWCRDDSLLAYRRSEIPAKVMRLNLNEPNANWKPMPSLQGLPRVALAGGDFREITSVAFNAIRPDSPSQDTVRPLLASGQDGVFRSTNGGESYEYLYWTADLNDREIKSVTLPQTWLFCSGTHEVTVKTEDETR